MGRQMASYKHVDTSPRFIAVDMNNMGQPQCCSLNKFWRPVELLIQYLVSFSRQILFASSFDYTWIASAFRARVGCPRNVTHDFRPPTFKPLWGEWHRKQGVFGAPY